MAQDDRSKGKPPVTPGKSPAPTAPDTPASHAINAPPPPEERVTQPTDAGPPATGMAGDGSMEARAGEQEGDEEPGVDETGQLEAAVEAAKKALKDKEEALARRKEEVAAEQAAADLVKAYKAEEEALRLAEKDLEQYQAAETDFVTRFLDPETISKIKDAAKAAQADIDELAATVRADETDAAARRKARDKAKEEAAKARAKADALKRPAGSIRDRLKAADAIRAEAKKASDDGKYALAYWLVMPGGKLDKAIKADPPILDPDDLRKQVKTARKAQEDAEKALADREKELKQAEDKLRGGQVKLVDLEKKLDASVLEKVAALNPTIVKAA